MTFNILDTPHKGIVRNQEKISKNITQYIEEKQEWCMITIIPCEKFTAKISNMLHDLSKCLDKENTSH